MSAAPPRPPGTGWRLYRCTNNTHAPYLTTGALYWLRLTRNGWLDDVGASRFSQHRFEEVTS